LALLRVTPKLVRGNKVIKQIDIEVMIDKIDQFSLKRILLVDANASVIGPKIVP
jgi:hypothetical protein